MASRCQLTHERSGGRSRLGDFRASAECTQRAADPESAVTIGDMTNTRVPGEFTLAYLVLNSIGNVTTQDGQVDCFVAAAAPLGPGANDAR